MFRRKRHQEEEEGESIFVSMTDLTVSILMIVIILLGFFASQMRDVQTLEELERLQNVLVERDQTIADQSDEIAALQLALDTSESARRRFEKLYERAISELEALRQSQTNLEADLGATIAEKQELEDQIVLLKSEYDVLVKSLEVAGVENDRLRESVASLTEQLVSTQEELSVTQAMLETREIELSEAKSQITDLSEALESESGKRVEAEDKLAATIQERDDLAADVADLRLSVAALEENRSELLQLRDELFAERDAIALELSKPATELRGLNSEIAARDNVIAGLTTEIAGLEDSLSVAKDEALKLGDALETERLRLAISEQANELALAENAVLRDEIAELKYSLAVAEAARDALSNAREELLVERDALQQQIQDQLETLAGAEDELNAARNEIKQAKQSHAEAIAVRDTTIADLRADISERVKLAEDSEAEIDRLTLALEARDGQIEALKADLVQSSSELSDALSQVAALEAIQGDNVSEVADLERAMEVLRFDLRQSLVALDETKSENAELASTITDLGIENAALGSELASIEDRLTEARDHATALGTQISELENARDELLKELEAVSLIVEQLQAEKALSEEAIASLASSSTDLQNALRDAETRISTLVDQVEAEIAAKGNVEQELTELQAALTQAQSSLDATFEELSATQQARNEAQASLAETANILNQRDSELANAITQLEAARSDAAEKGQRLATGDENFQDLQKQFQIQRIVLMLRQGRFDRAVQDAEDLTKKLSAAEAEVIRLTEELSQLQPEASEAAETEQ